MANKDSNELATMDEFQQFLAVVPDDKRRGVATMLQQHDMTTYDGFINFTQSVMCAVLAGDIPPPIAQEARHWAELAFTAIAVASDKYNISPQQTQKNVVNILQQAIDSVPVVDAVEVFTVIPQPELVEGFQK